MQCDKFYFHFTQAAYTAEGQVIKAVLIHGGEVEGSLQDTYINRIGFIESDDGDLSYDSVGMIVQEVYRYKIDNYFAPTE